MKKLISTLLLLPVIVYAKTHIVSPVPLPSTYIQDLDPYPCNEKCMQMYLNNGMIFSFLSHANTTLENPKHEEVRTKQIAILNLGSSVIFTPNVPSNVASNINTNAIANITPNANTEINTHVEPTSVALTTNVNPSVINSDIKIAILLPYKKIGKYAASTTNAVLSYLIAKNHSFELKSYKIESESINDIQKALTQIKQDGFIYIIAPLTSEGADTVAKINPDINIFFPTINKNESNTQSSYLYFGGIDYKAQSELLTKEAVSPLVIFYDKSAISSKLALYEEEQFKKRELPSSRVINYSIPATTTNLSTYLKDKNNIKNGSYFINTPIVKTGMIMSQLTLYDVSATNVLSTQINYDPLLLSMTQYDDRKNMIVANSITLQNNTLIETNSLLDNDIVYDWINYTTTIGIDYFFNLITKGSREYNIPLENNQVKHEIELLKPTQYRFVKLQSGLEE